VSAAKATRTAPPPAARPLSTAPPGTAPPGALGGTGGLPQSSMGVYAISIAADLVGSGAQSLRLYERRGLLAPERSAGGTRRYSAEDVDAARRIEALLADGLNLTGVARVLQLEAENTSLRAEVRALRAQTAAGRGPQPGQGSPARS
jgi:MerR family transcriptional regulator/heat shock protein HspR